MKKLIISSLAAFALLFSAKADSSCATDCTVSVDNTVTSGVSWANTGSGFNVIGPDQWEGVGILSSGQPCSWMVGPTLTVFLSAPATNELVVGSVIITCPVGLAHQVQSQSISFSIAQGNQSATFQFFVCQCNGQGACAVCICRNGAMYTPPANQGPPQS